MKPTKINYDTKHPAAPMPVNPPDEWHRPTDNEIRTRIAEACGWSIEGEKWRDILLHKPNGSVVRPSDPRINVVDLLPDYLTSLDAMHEAEKVLTDEQQAKYENALWELVQPTSEFRGPKGYAHCNFRVLSATARQRALAFLATIAP